MLKGKEPATPEVAWYLDNVVHHFSIVRERDNTYYFRGFHENTTDRPVLGGTFTIRMRQGDEWRHLKSIPFGLLEPEGRKTFDVYLQEIPRDDERRKIEWELTKVQLRGGV